MLKKDRSVPEELFAQKRGWWKQENSKPCLPS